MQNFHYFIDWLEEHEKLAGWAQFAAATVTLGAAFLIANMPIWAQQRERKERQTELEGALLDLTTRAAGGMQYITDAIADTHQRHLLATNEDLMLMDIDLAISELNSFPKLDISNSDVRYRFEDFRTLTRRNRHNVKMTLEQVRTQGDLHPDWLEMTVRCHGELRDMAVKLAGAVGASTAHRDVNSPAIHRHPDAQI